MTQEQPVLAGRKLDIVIAERVIGGCMHELISSPSAYMQSIEKKGPCDWTRYECVKCKNRYPDRFTVHLPNYSTSIVDAWAVVEAMQQRGWLVFLEMRSVVEGGYRVRVSYSDTSTHDDCGALGEAVSEGQCLADTAPLAICIAALRSIAKKEAL